MFTVAARRDLTAIGEWIAKNNLGRAESFVDEITSVCARILEFPEAYSIHRKHPRTVRRRTYGNYRIFYEVQVDHVRILSVVHGARSDSTTP